MNNCISCRAIYSENYIISTNTTDSTEDFPVSDHHLGLYSGTVIGYIALEVLRSICVLFVTTTSARSLHDKMFHVILHAKLNFFERTPIGTYAYYRK